MTRRTTLTTLLLVLFLLIPSPATAKGPSQVEVRDQATGTTTLLTWDDPELMPLMELAAWPSNRRKPQVVANGELPHVATLAWQFEDGQSVWLDRVYSDGSGTTWIARRDHLSGNEFVTWGRVRTPFALEQLIAGLGDGPAPAAETTVTSASAKASTTGARATRDGFDSASFGWGAAAAALLAGTIGLAFRRRRAARA